MIGASGLTLSDIGPERTPNLWSMVEDGASANLAVRTLTPATCAAAGWLSFGAGARMHSVDLTPDWFSPLLAHTSCPRMIDPVPDSAAEAPDAEDPDAAEPSVDSDVAHDPDVAAGTPVAAGPATFEDFDRVLAANAGSGYNAVPGIFTRSAENGDWCTAAYGRGAAYAAADEEGHVKTWAPTTSLVTDPTGTSAEDRERADPRRVRAHAHRRGHRGGPHLGAERVARVERRVAGPHADRADRRARRPGRADPRADAGFLRRRRRGPGRCRLPLAPARGHRVGPVRRARHAALVIDTSVGTRAAHRRAAGRDRADRPRIGGHVPRGIRRRPVRRRLHAHGRPGRGFPQGRDGPHARADLQRLPRRHPLRAHDHAGDPAAGARGPDSADEDAPHAHSAADVRRVGVLHDRAAADGELRRRRPAVGSRAGARVGAHRCDRTGHGGPRGGVDRGTVATHLAGPCGGGVAGVRRRARRRRRAGLAPAVQRAHGIQPDRRGPLLRTGQSGRRALPRSSAPGPGHHRVTTSSTRAGP